MKGHNSYVLDLIDSYSGAGMPRLPTSLADQDFEHLYAFGLASIALGGLESRPDHITESAHELLQNADLTARVIYGQLRAATLEILDVAQQHDVPVVLLKGISIAEHLYAEPHHRLMGDVDVLVPDEVAENFYDLLQKMGYQDHPQNSPSQIQLKRHHHLPALQHPESKIAVEVHTSLFSDAPIADENLFQTPMLWKHTEATEFHGIRCLRFRPELQLLYATTHWAIDQKWAVNVISINDVVLMLRSTTHEIDWKLIEAMLAENPLVADDFAVLHLYLTNLGIVEQPAIISTQIRKSAERIGSANMRILHRLIDEVPLAGERKSASPIKQIVAQVIFQTMLEPRHKSLRLVFGLARVVFRRTPGKSLPSSLIGRVRSFIELLR